MRRAGIFASQITAPTVKWVYLYTNSSDPNIPYTIETQESEIGRVENEIASAFVAGSPSHPIGSLACAFNSGINEYYVFQVQGV